MTVFVVFCRIDGLEEYDRIYATEHGARAYCQQQNARPRYFGRFTFAATQVRDEEVATVQSKAHVLRKRLETMPTDKPGGENG